MCLPNVVAAAATELLTESMLMKAPIAGLAIAPKNQLDMRSAVYPLVMRIRAPSTLGSIKSCS